MKNRSIRFRLTVWYSLALTAGLLTFALAIYASMKSSLTSEMDRALTARAEGFAAFVQREMAEGTTALHEELEEYSGALPRGAVIQIHDPTGRTLLDSTPNFPGSKVTPEILSPVIWEGHRYRTLLLNRPKFQLCLAEPMDAVESMLNRLFWLLIGCMPPVILAASLGGNWLSRRALNPVDRITQAAQSVGIANLSERLDVPQTGDELQRLTETWNGMLTRLEAAVKRLSRFTADASHELRTPLAVIRTTAEIATRRARSPDAYQEALGGIVAETQRMTHLVEDLLFLARCDSEAAEMPMMPVDLAAAVEDACCQARPLSDARGIEIESGGGNSIVVGNSPAIRQLLMVLLDNAIKYSATGTAVRVTVAERSVEIADRGTGIPETDMPHIFERFYRARQNGTEAASGYGLGLSLADAIAKRHRARIEVNSAIGEGSTFRVVFE